MPHNPLSDKMEDNGYDEQSPPDEATGYGGSALQNPWGGSDPFELSSGLPVDHDNPYPVYTSPAVPQQQPSFGTPGASSSNEIYFGGPSYGEVHVASEHYPEPVEGQESYRNHSPGDMLVPSSWSQLVPTLNHVTEGFPQRPETELIDDLQPPQALQRPLSSNSNKALHTSVKVTDIDLGRYNLYLKAELWFIKQQPEPQSIAETDIFVLRGYVEAGAVSRFCWLIRQDAQGRYCCRIPHIYSQGKKKNQPCDHNCLKLKDAIAHVREYYKYAPYPCLGTAGHDACEKKFYTTERRHDHYCKKRTNPDKKVKCAHCDAKEMLSRNLSRHMKKKHPDLSLPTS